VKLILSRKGFDSSAGGVASPIMPDGRLLSLPIPDAQAPCRYRDLTLAGEPAGALVRQLTRGRLTGAHRAHLDPDLEAAALPRHPEWRPAFGQTGAAQGHLRNRGVDAGDLFLFFGWFREVARHRGERRFRREAPDRHILFGWLQTERILDLGNQTAPAAWRDHPHCHGERGRNNRLYIAAERLRLPGNDIAAPGAGLFTHDAPALRLTAPGGPRGRWLLPRWFHPEGRASTLSYHERPERWRREGDRVALHCAARGQEFVLDCDHYPEALAWAADLIGAHGGAAS